MIKPNTTIPKLALAALMSIATGLACAQSYPSKPIRVVLPFGPGSATDAVMRTIAQPLSVSLGQQVIIEHKPGADGAISALEVARAAPDGYTLGVGSGGPMAAVPALRKNPPYNVKTDFTPISDIGRYTVFLFINAELPAKNFSEFVAYVKANPGKVAYGTGNPSGIVAFAQMNSMLSLQMLHVPYKSSPPIMPDLLSNRVQALMDPPTVALAHVKEGKLRALVTTLDRRSHLLPDVPTIREAGVPNYTISNWMGLIGPAGIAPDVLERLNRDIGKVLRDPEVITGLSRHGFVPKPGTPAEFAAFINEQVDSYGSLLRSAGVQPD